MMRYSRGCAQDEAAVKDLNDQIATLRDNLSYVQDNINECQSSIVQMEENKVSQRSRAWAMEAVEELRGGNRVNDRVGLW